MKTFLLSIFLIFVFSIAAEAKNKTIGIDTLIDKKVKTERDGSSFDKAIIIQETSERTGVHAEYAWIKDKYPGYKNNGQSLTYHDKKPFDIINITTADGQTVAVYFDISNYFGKF